ncbi:hypothetical protein niasHT_033329 [Heterodera trifolii]|uniref:Uncharacterized protein n=1 Tax=Heterodera trifolii TaxID=157864 RepID=A0ABD2I4A9_9BILA
MTMNHQKLAAFSRFGRRLLCSAAEQKQTAPNSPCTRKLVVPPPPDRPELDFDFLLDDANAAFIERNIRCRKGIGDVQRVRFLWAMTICALGGRWHSRCATPVHLLRRQHPVPCCGPGDDRLCHQADCALKVIEKRDLAELVGHLAERRCPTDPSKLFLNAGSIAYHVVTLDFLRAACDKADDVLPYHAARKRVPFWDTERQTMVQPTGPNAVKLERFIFDPFVLSK